MPPDVAAALVNWLREHGLDDTASDFDEQRVWRVAGDVLWSERGVPTLEPEDVAPVVTGLLGRDDPDAYGEAAWALTEAIHVLGEMPDDPDQVGSYLDGCVEWAVRRARKRLHLHEMTSTRENCERLAAVASQASFDEIYRTAVRLFHRQRFGRTLCLRVRPRGGRPRTSRGRRLGVRRRRRSPTRRTSDGKPEPDPVARPLGGRLCVRDGRTIDARQKALGRRIDGLQAEFDANEREREQLVRAHKLAVSGYTTSSTSSCVRSASEWRG